VKLGFSTLAAPDRPLRDLAQAVARAGYDGLELRGVDRKHLDPAMTGDERAEVRRILSDAGLEAVAVTSYDRLTKPAGGPEAGADRIRAHIALARDVGAAGVRLFGGNVPQGEQRSDAEARAAALLASVADDAAAAGVRLCLETHDAFSTGRQVAALLRRVNHAALAALWDVHHPWRSGERPEDTLDVLWPAIAYLHVKDAFTMPDGSRQLCLLGAGDVPVREILGLLKRRGYGGYLVVEWEKPWQPEIPSVDVAIGQHILKLREYLGETGE